MLEVKPATLYAYVSRGLLRSIAAAHGRARRYALEDILRLKAKRDARSGHTAVAAAALDFGQPVLDSALTRIDERGPHYRGRAAVDLAAAGASFEDAREWLWQGLSGAEPAAPAAVPALEPALRRLEPLARAAERPVVALRLLCLLASLHDRDALGAGVGAELARARALSRAFASALGMSFGRKRIAPRANERSAEIASRAFGAGRAAAPSIDTMLILALDHELNVSTFAVRVTASTGADLYACVGAGMCALSGPLHGGLCDRVEALIRDCARPKNARALIRERARLGEYVPGFGQPLYPKGDPRALFLLARARAQTRLRPRAKIALAIAETMAEHGHADPNLDFGLCALSAALGLPEGAPAALFALARTSGWVAHALEQRAQATLLRPRARYVGDFATESDTRGARPAD